MKIEATTTGIASESGHWYNADGTPCYEIQKKPKNKADVNPGMRPVTLRDARTMNLYPGFSTIAKMEYKPQLEAWKIEQAYLACLTLPRVEGETLEAFKARAQADAAAQASKARDRGTELHAAMEDYYLGNLIRSEDYAYVQPVAEALAERFPDEQWLAEKSFASPFGYGGKIDLSSRRVVVDFKFKDFTDPDTVRAYDEHEMQLHAYAVGLKIDPWPGIPDPILLNVFVSSTQPNTFKIVQWPWRDEAFEAFKCLLRLWQIRKGYKPQ